VVVAIGTAYGPTLVVFHDRKTQRIGPDRMRPPETLAQIKTRMIRYDGYEKAGASSARVSAVSISKKYREGLGRDTIGRVRAGKLRPAAGH